MKALNFICSLIIVLLLAGCSGHPTFWLEQDKRYTVNKGDTPRFSFLPPDQRRWYVPAPITLEERGFVGMTTYLNNEVRLELMYRLNDVAPRMSLPWRRDVRNFFTQGDIGLYIRKDRAPIEWNGKLLIRDETAININGYQCMASAYMNPKEVRPNLFLDNVKVTCPIVVDGKVKLLIVHKTILATEPVLIDDVNDKTAQLQRVSNSAINRFFSDGIQRSMDSLVIYGEKISQSIEDVDDLSMFDKPTILFNGLTIEENKEKNEKESAKRRAKLKQKRENELKNRVTH